MQIAFDLEELIYFNQCSDIGDHRIEVIGLENCLHMGQVRTGLKASARRLGEKLFL